METRGGGLAIESACRRSGIDWAGRVAPHGAVCTNSVPVQWAKRGRPACPVHWRDGQFGAPVFNTPFNYKWGYNYGVELSASYVVGGFSAYGAAKGALVTPYQVNGHEVEEAAQPPLQFLLGVQLQAAFRENVLFHEVEHLLANDA